MTRFWIVGLTAAVVIALAARWVPLEVGGAGDECSGGGTCTAEPPLPGGSGGPDWFYGGEGADRIRDDDRPGTREEPGGGDTNRCGPGRYDSPTGAEEEHPRGCEDVRARFY